MGNGPFKPSFPVADEQGRAIDVPDKFVIIPPSDAANQPLSYVDIGKSIGKLVTEKQAAYGDAFGRSGAVMRILYPDGIPHEKMDDSLTVLRILDKFFRITTDRDALGESPWRDIAGYAVLAVKRQEGAGQ